MVYLELFIWYLIYKKLLCFQHKFRRRNNEIRMRISDITKLTWPNWMYHNNLGHYIDPNFIIGNYRFSAIFSKAIWFNLNPPLFSMVHRCSELVLFCCTRSYYLNLNILLILHTIEGVNHPCTEPCTAQPARQPRPQSNPS